VLSYLQEPGSFAFESNPTWTKSGNLEVLLFFFAWRTILWINVRMWRFFWKNFFFFVGWTKQRKQEMARRGKEEKVSSSSSFSWSVLQRSIGLGAGTHAGASTTGGMQELLKVSGKLQ
jgi:hypothetical protein